MTMCHFDRHPVQTGAVQNFARHFRSRHARTGRHLDVMPIGAFQLELRVEPKKQSRDQEHEIHWIHHDKTEHTHKTLPWLTRSASEPTSAKAQGMPSGTNLKSV